MKKVKPTALQSLKLALAHAEKALQTAKAASASWTRTTAKAAAQRPSSEGEAPQPCRRVQALPQTPAGQRVDNCPYRKESRQ